MDKVLFPAGHDVYTDDLGDAIHGVPQQFLTLSGIIEDELQDRLAAIGSLKGVAEGFTLAAGINKVTVAAGQGYDSLKRRLKTTDPTDVTISIGDEGKYVVARVAPTGQLPTVVYGRNYFKKTVEQVQFAVVASPGVNDVRLGRVLTVNPGSSPVVTTNPQDRDIFVLLAKYPFVVVAADGSGDYATIDAAVAALNHGGGTIFVAPGSYAITDPIFYYSGITIRGAGPSTVINLDAGPICFVIGGGVGDEATINSAALMDMRINLNYSVGTAVTLVSCSNARGVRIRNLLLTNSGGATDGRGISFGSAISGSSIVGCRIKDLARGIRFFGDPTTVNNVAKSNHVTGFGAYGIEIGGTELCTHLSANRLVGAGGTSVGIEFRSIYASISRNIVSGCQTGIDVYSGQKGTITKNVVVGNSGVGVLLRAASAKMAVVANVAAPNTGTPISNLGTDNIVNHNITA